MSKHLCTKPRDCGRKVCPYEYTAQFLNCPIWQAWADEFYGLKKEDETK